MCRLWNLLKTEIPNRDTVFYLEFPHYWADQDLFNLFKPLGKILNSWISKTSCFVALKTTENLKGKSPTP